MAYVAGNRSTTLSLGNRLGEIYTGLVEAYSAHRVYRRTLAELQDLSARELADLGLNKTMLRAIAYDAAYGKKA